MQFDQIVAGGLAGVVAGGFTHPLDVVRLRQQLRQRLMFRFPGLWGALVKEGVYSAVRVSTYQEMTVSCGPSPTLGDSALRFLCGGVAGVTGTVISHPLDLVKVVKVVSPTQPSYGRIVRNIFAKGEMFRALLPAIQRSVVFSAAQLATYDVCKSSVRNVDPELDYRWTVLLSAWMAGLVSTLLATPLEVAKTRLIVSDFRGTYDCLRCIARYEGVRYLWNGVVATWLRLGPYTLLQMIVWESSLRFLQEKTFKN